MSLQLAHVIAGRLNMQPALIAPAHADMLLGCLRTLASADADVEEAQQEKARYSLLAAYGYEAAAEDQKLFVYADGIAFIPVTGMLVNRFHSTYGWITGYNFIRAWLNAALEDDDVKMIVLDCNSGGGEVSGCFELCADIRAARDIKPIMAMVDAASYSACYAIASSASKVVVTPSGGVGSVGVVAMHVDMSKFLSDVGFKVTFIFSGDHKVDGNPYEPLPEPVRKSIQARVDSTRQEFVSLVAGNRGLDTKVVFDTQAQCYTASEALTLGLIDAIAPPLEAVQAFLIGLSGSQTEQETTMSTSAAAKTGTESTAATQEEKDAAAATAAAATAAAATAAAATAAAATAAAAAAAAAATVTVDASAERAAERERIAAITGNEAAKDKTGLANHLALNTALSVEDAVKVLSAAAPEKAVAAVAGTSAFVAAMNTSEHPNIGAEGAAGGEATAAQRILASHAAATGIKH